MPDEDSLAAREIEAAAKSDAELIQWSRLSGVKAIAAQAELRKRDQAHSKTIADRALAATDRARCVAVAAAVAACGSAIAAIVSATVAVWIVLHR